MSINIKSFSLPVIFLIGLEASRERETSSGERVDRTRGEDKTQTHLVLRGSISGAS
jgi:hypothetical protein